jgi:hypothetical protein
MHVVMPLTLQQMCIAICMLLTAENATVSLHVWDNKKHAVSQHLSPVQCHGERRGINPNS